MCLLGNFVKVTVAQAKRLVVGLGCMWKSSQYTAHLRRAPRAYSGVKRVIFVFHLIALFLLFLLLLSFSHLPPSFYFSLKG